MATYAWGVDYTFLADVDLNSYQYRFVKAASTAGYVELQATAGASVMGVLQNDPRAGEEATVRVLGFSKVQADAASALSIGGFVKAGSTGLALGYDTMTASTMALGKSYTAVSSGSTSYATVFVFNPPVHF